eukprot:TRINITY_DN63832_c0_g1_i1.p1 TRINITY_DN63832_c0_g1~~TRINITY_DN63832_c0_g1_i1.p1  ORF type:complete len:404 (-),score=3.48 TRINITY_DN63832_c0_g1_i1:124-1335(-)
MRSCLELVLTSVFVRVVESCLSQWDCSLNGDCVDGTCRCDAAFKGSACSVLNLRPMSPEAAQRGAYRHGSATSWGGAPLRDEHGRYHLYVSEIANNCTLKSWIPNSRITHAVADSPEGPYRFHSTVFETFHHNPTVVRHVDSRGNSLYLMYLIGGKMEGTLDCSSRSGTDAGEEFDSSILVSSAPALEGPWSTPVGPLITRGTQADWDYVVTNPSPVILENGTVLLYYRGTPHYWGRDRGSPWHRNGSNDLPESIGLAIAPHWSGPYVKRFREPILKTMNEDPFAWRDSRGFKMLTHARNDWWNTHFAFSHDGLTWSSGDAVATGPNVTLTDGTVHRFTNRERPHIYFNESTGAPAILFNGVCPFDKYDYAYTIAQYLEQDNHAFVSSGSTGQADSAYVNIFA